jgi:predicted membrane protein
MENNEMKNSFRSGRTKGLGFGVLLVAVGVIFLAVNAGLIATPLKWVLISWPMLLIVIGAAKIFKREYFTAAILFIIGAFFLAPKIIRAYPESFPGMDGNFTHTYWPLLLIAAGILLVLSKLFGKQWGFQDSDYKNCYKKAGNADGYISDYYKGRTGSFERNAIFGGGEHIVLEPDFKGGEINAVFGGLTLDLRHTNLAEGTSHLEANAVFGGVTVIIPNDWYVETSIDAVFGGFEDKRIVKQPINTERKLLITGACVFGGGELRN